MSRVLKGVMKKPMLPSTPPLLITRSEAASLLQISVRTLSKLLQNGSLPFVRVGKRSIRILPDDLVRHLETQREASQGVTSFNK